MRITTASAIVASLTTPVAAITGSVFPLYIYPSAVYNDGAALWQSSIKAIKSAPGNPWLVVVNPDSGPGGPQNRGKDDINTISGVSQLNALTNVKTVGYVHTTYGQANMDQLKANITEYSAWATKNIPLGGIFFDESSTANATYLKDATAFTKQAFNNDVTTICNFGARASVEFYDICDVVIAFESCLNCDGGPQYKSGETIDANFIAGREGQGSIVLNRFTGAAYDGRQASPSLLNEYVQVASGRGVGWVYFTAADYNNVDAGVINIGDMANALAAVA